MIDDFDDCPITPREKELAEDVEFLERRLAAAAAILKKAVACEKSLRLGDLKFVAAEAEGFLAALSEEY